VTKKTLGFIGPIKHK